MYSLIQEKISSFPPVGLEDIDNVRLMDRIDTKYIFTSDTIPEILTMMNGFYKTLEINNARLFMYKSTYYDTSDFLFFRQHVTHKPGRDKVRYRKYEATDTTFLEIKRKTKRNRTVKWRIQNEPAVAGLLDATATEFIHNHIPVDARLLKPVLSNSYRRLTLIGAEVNERITIDFDLNYTGLGKNICALPHLAILELKREGQTSESPVTDILKELEIKPAGFSKYCIGTAILNDPPRKNTLKPKLFLIKRIEDESGTNGS